MSNAREKNWSYTNIKSNKVKIDWIIRNFELLPQKNGESISSPIFTICNGDRWKLAFYPRARFHESPDTISLFLNYESPELGPVRGQCEFVIMKSNNVIRTRNFNFIFDSIEGHGYNNFMKRSRLINAISPDDLITISCTICIIETVATSSLDATLSSNNQSIILNSRGSNISDDFRSLYNCPKLCDFNIIVGDQKFPTHKVILSSRSSVFAAMFDHEEINENQRNEMIIEDIEPDVIRRMLEFIYTDNIADIEKFANDLLIVGEKYALEGLKILCESTISKNLNRDNAVDLLIFADVHRADQLKNYIMQYIIHHRSYFVESDEFKTADISPMLVKELMCLMVRIENEEKNHVFDADEDFKE